MPRQKRLNLRLLASRLNIGPRFNKLLENQMQEIRQSPHRFALGCALGLAINFIPTFGLGFVLAFLLAALLRINRVSAPAVSLLTGPLVPLMYALNLLVGGLVQAGETENLFAFIARQYALIFKISSPRQQFLNLLDVLGSMFIIGSLINAAIAGTCFYLFVRYLIDKKTQHKG